MKTSWIFAFIILMIPSWVKSDANVPDNGSVTPKVAGSTVTLQAPNKVDLGSPLELTLTATTATDNRVSLSDDQALTPFEMLSRNVNVQPDVNQQNHTFTFHLKLISFESGAHVIGPLKVQVSTPQGKLDYLETETKTIHVQSLLSNEPNPELQPPTQPVVVKQDDYRPLWILGGLFAMAIAAFAAWSLFRWRSGREHKKPTGPPPAPPWEVALEELRGLQTQRVPMIEQGQIEVWVDAVSDTIRRYLGERFDFHGLESTTDEIARKLAQATELNVEVMDAVGFLAQCDLVKFARASLADEASTTLFQDAFTLVEKTRSAPVNSEEATS